MPALLDVVDDVLQQLAVSFEALIASNILGILLNGPHGPEGNVGLLHLIDFYAQGLVLHELTQAALGGIHHQLKVVGLVDGQRQAGQGNKGVAGAALEPRIAGQQIARVVGLAVVELVGGGDQTMVEVVAGHAQVYLLLEKALQRARLDGLRRGGEDDALVLLDGNLEIAWHVEVLVGGVATLLLLRVLDATVPVGLEDELAFLVELHVEVGIAGVHAGLDAVLHLVILTAGHAVLVRELPHRAEG